MQVDGDFSHDPFGFHSGRNGPGSLANYNTE